MGKVSLIAAVWCVSELGNNLSLAERFSPPEIDWKIDKNSTDTKASRPFSSYAVISQRNIFGVDKSSSEATPQQAAVTSLGLRLVGTNVSSNAASFAIIEDTKSKNQDVFDLNEMVFDQAKLVAVTQEHVKLERNGRIELLELDEGSGSSSASGGDSESSVQSLNADQTEFSVAESELTDALANLPRLLSQARAVPYFRNGKSVGMRLFAIRRGSLYEKLGLKNGDIIKEVNNSSLSDPAQALKLFEQLKNERSVYVKTERAGQDLELRYSIQ